MNNIIGVKAMSSMAPKVRFVLLMLLFSVLFSSGLMFWPVLTWLVLVLAVSLFAFHFPIKMHILTALSLVFISIFPRIFLFNYQFDTSGEIQHLYLHFLEAQTTPLQEGYRFFYLEPAIFVIMHYFAEILGLNPVEVVKFARLFIGALAILIVYYLGKDLNIKDREITEHLNAFAVFSAMIFAFHYNQLWYLEGDQFKNAFGHLFFLGFLYFFLSSGRKKLGILLSLYTFAAFSHRLYIFLLPLMLIGLLINRRVEKNSCRLKRFAPVITCAIILLVLKISFVILTPYRDFLGMGYVGVIEGGLTSIPIFWEFVRPGLALFNMWGLGLFVSYFLMYKSINKNPQLKTVFIWFFLIFALSKGYLFGVTFNPGRFAILLPAFQAILTGYILFKLFFSNKIKILGLFLIMVVFFMLSFSIINFGGEYYGKESGRIITHIMNLDFDSLFASTFGEIPLEWIGMVDLLFGGAVFAMLLGLAIFNRLNNGIILMLLTINFITISISYPFEILRWIDFFSLLIVPGYLLKDFLLARKEGVNNPFLCPLLSMGYISFLISVIWILNPSIPTSDTKLVALMLLSMLFFARLIKKGFIGRYQVNRGFLPSNLKTARRLDTHAKS